MREKEEEERERGRMWRSIYIVITAGQSQTVSQAEGWKEKRGQPEVEM